MADTTFVDEVTVIEPAWLNAINDFFYTLFAGATTAAAARTAIGAAASGANSDITSITGLTTDLAVTHGGTGASDAPTARSNLGAVGNLLSTQVFTSSGTWTKPTNCKYIIVEGCGGGGGGGGVQGDATNHAAASSGCPGAYGKTLLTDVSAIASATVTIGAAGSAGAAGNNAGGNGGNTTWSDGTNSWTWGGGTGGRGAAAGTANQIYEGLNGNPPTVSGTGLYGGALTLGDKVVRGSNLARGTHAAGGMFGTGGTNSGADSAGNAGSGYGAAGSGASVSSAISGTRSGGAGTAGLIIVWEYY